MQQRTGTEEDTRGCIRNDLVARRLAQVDHELFVYHVNNECYKSYTVKKTLTKLEEESSKATEKSEGDESVPNPSVSRATMSQNSTMGSFIY